MEMPFVLGGVIGGALIGVAADRLASRWPAHPDGSIRPVDWRTAAVVLGGAAAFGGLVARWDDPRDLLVLGIYIAALIVLLATDLDQMLLPDLITLPLIVYTAVLLVAGLNPVLAEKGLGLVSGLIAAVVAPALLWVTDKLFRGALGMGDLKLAVSLGLVAGLTNLFVGFLVATVAFAFVVILLLATRRVSLRTAIPFGPALIAAGVIAILLT
jgi:leader peptidase (prepilin peptidase) / N-methyltransferase